MSKSEIHQLKSSSQIGRKGTGACTSRKFLAAKQENLSQADSKVLVLEV
jgi:hypothetical protein